MRRPLHIQAHTHTPQCVCTLTVAQSPVLCGERHTVRVSQPELCTFQATVSEPARALGSWITLRLNCLGNFGNMVHPAPGVSHFGTSFSKCFKSPFSAWTAKLSWQVCSDLVQWRSSYVETPYSQFPRSASETLNRPFHLHFSPPRLSLTFVITAANVEMYLIRST